MPFRSRTPRRWYFRHCFGAATDSKPICIHIIFYSWTGYARERAHANYPPICFSLVQICWFSMKNNITFHCGGEREKICARFLLFSFRRFADSVLERSLPPFSRPAFSLPHSRCRLLYIFIFPADNEKYFSLLKKKPQSFPCHICIRRN